MKEKVLCCNCLYYSDLSDTCRIKRVFIERTTNKVMSGYLQSGKFNHCGYFNNKNGGQ